MRALIAAFVLTLLAAAVAHAPTRPATALASPAGDDRPRAAATVRPRAVAAGPIAPARLVAHGGIKEAQRWARQRAGTVAFAVGEGRRIRGIAIHRT